MRSSTKVDQERTQLEKDLKEAIKQREIVEVQMHSLAREILVLLTQKKDLSIVLSKSRSNIKQLELSISIKKSEFWSLKNENL